jgi:NAD(P)-dependent dehydrogenase (short-subunit alcohol dehydrogenase family)
MGPFHSQVAIVTGGASGIGRALCEELSRRGAMVIIADIEADAAERLALSIIQTGARARAAHLDVASERDVTHLIEAVASEYGRIDYMFNNAGIAIGGDARDLSSDQWRRVLDVNLYGVLHGALAAYRVMARQGHGHIVNTASVTGLFPQPGNAPYCTSKYGIVGFSLSLRCEGADLGVKVSAVCPGRVDANIFQSAVIMNIPRERVTARFRTMHAATAARLILRGVSRNRGLIVFPVTMRIAWRLYRLFPWVSDAIGVRMMRNLRRLRIAPQ